MSKKSSRFLNILVSIAIVLFSLLGSVHFWSFNEDFYTKQHSKLTLYGKSIAEHIGISEDNLKELTHFTLEYLNDPNRDLELQMSVHGVKREIFTDDEKAHMVDVRRLNITANFLIIISAEIIFFGVVFRIFKGKSFYPLFKEYKNVLLGCLCFFGVLSMWILIDFDSFWISFHHLFFPGNDLWILDLRKDILIMIVPPQFFNNLVIRIVTTFFVLIIGSYFVLKYLSKVKTND